MVAGLIYNPASEEMFIAERGKGAFLNEQRIRVAARKRLADAVSPAGCRIAAAAISRSAHRRPAPCRPQVAGLRRFGAAALDLAWVAAGRLDGYWERNIKPWDVAAGLILVREAGGFVSDCDGGDDMLGQGRYRRRQRGHPERAGARAQAGRQALTPRNYRPQFQLIQPL